MEAKAYQPHRHGRLDDGEFVQIAEAASHRDHSKPCGGNHKEAEAEKQDCKGVVPTDRIRLENQSTTDTASPEAEGEVPTEQGAVPEETLKLEDLSTADPLNYNGDGYASQAWLASQMGRNRHEVSKFAPPPGLSGLADFMPDTSAHASSSKPERIQPQRGFHEQHAAAADLQGEDVSDDEDGQGAAKPGESAELIDEASYNPVEHWLAQADAAAAAHWQGSGPEDWGWPQGMMPPPPMPGPSAMPWVQDALHMQAQLAQWAMYCMATNQMPPPPAGMAGMGLPYGFSPHLAAAGGRGGRGAAASSGPDLQEEEFVEGDEGDNTGTTGKKKNRKRKKNQVTKFNEDAPPRPQVTKAYRFIGTEADALERGAKVGEVYKLIEEDMDMLKVEIKKAVEKTDHSPAQPAQTAWFTREQAQECTDCGEGGEGSQNTSKIGKVPEGEGAGALWLQENAPACFRWLLVVGARRPLLKVDKKLDENVDVAGSWLLKVGDIVCKKSKLVLKYDERGSGPIPAVWKKICEEHIAPYLQYQAGEMMKDWKLTPPRNLESDDALRKKLLDDLKDTDEGKAEYRCEIVGWLMERIVQIARLRDTCRLAQETFKPANDEQRVFLVAKLAEAFDDLYKCPNGNHVVAKAIEDLPSDNDMLNGIFEQASRKPVEVAKDRCGGRILERLISVKAGLERFDPIVRELAPHSEALCRDKFGNFVMKRILQKSPGSRPIWGSQVLQELILHVPRFAMHKTASHVVQEALRSSDASDKIRILDALIQAPEPYSLKEVALHKAGGYVVNEVLGLDQHNDPQLRDKIKEVKEILLAMFNDMSQAERETHAKDHARKVMEKLELVENSEEPRP
eukprot:TRINITY_DN25754_c0_g1_i1.p1 TRINITY_DN25754_c0_g1~~TRINITY_DN25754_c0_g1_i1.p1  ORF type:complete len:850 (-),score=173.14 TRINITY_DN25754_c0_g1_i1:247-2796(-)